MHRKYSKIMDYSLDIWNGRFYNKMRHFEASLNEYAIKRWHKLLELEKRCEQRLKKSTINKWLIFMVLYGEQKKLTVK